MGGRFFNPRVSNNFLDTCAFDPYESEIEFSKEILNLHHQGKVLIILSHTNQKEIEHPNTPSEVKSEAAKMIFTLPVKLSQDEESRLSEILLLLTGNASSEAHRADATHINESIKYAGCFITTDKRIFRKKLELESMGAIILKPSEWIYCYRNQT